MSLLDALRAIPDQTALALSQQIASASRSVIEAKERVARAEAAVERAAADKTAADDNLASANARMEDLRAELAAFLSPA